MNDRAATAHQQAQARGPPLVFPEDGRCRCADRPVKAAGAEPGDHRPWGKKPERFRCTPKSAYTQQCVAH
jgi:hypothetical protein